ncbi:hypothetical protein [Streptomyces sp. NPDC007369]|uniref:hypothetical protein n=1 Tax=Streptomyces sp. NPDC007369 TaxID=3154589 RepID=UPI0033C21B0C
MTRSKLEKYDEGQAAKRLRVPRAAWRWAVHTGAVPPPDAGAGLWSRAAVEAVDAAAVRDALPQEPTSAYTAAQRLGEALAPWDVPVSTAAVIELAAAGLLVSLSGDPEAPTFHPDQVEALAAHPDLPAVVASAVPLGPDQAAQRLSVRRSDYDRMVALGWITPLRYTWLKFPRSQGGPVRVPLYDADQVALLPTLYPEADWTALQDPSRKGRRSVLFGKTPGEYEHVNLTQVARIAGVGRAAVANWRRRHADFPASVPGTESTPVFARAAAIQWLRAHGKLAVPPPRPRPALVTLADGGVLTLEAPDWRSSQGREELGGYIARDSGMPWPTADLVRVQVPGQPEYAVDQADVDISYSGSPTRQYLKLRWPASRRHALPAQPAVHA